MRFLNKITNAPNFSRGMVFLDQAMVSGSNFLIGILLVRSIGLSAYGIFTLLWMGVLFAMGLHQAFIIKPILSIAPKLGGDDQVDYLAGTHSIQYLTSGFFLILGLCIYGGVQIFSDSEFPIYIPLISMVIFCQTIHDFYRKLYLIKDHITRVFMLDSILYGGQLAGVFIFLILGKLTTITTLQIILSANILSVLVGKYKQEFSLKNYKKILIRHFHFSKWLLGTSILQWLSGNYFIIVGASILGTSAVGAIRMVQNLMGLCHILFLVMESIIPIEAARQFQAEGGNGLIRYLGKITKKLGLGFGVLLVVIAFFASPLLSLIYGSAAADYSYVAVAYALLYWFVFLGHPFRFYLRTIENTSPIFFAYCLGALFSLGFAYILLNHMGIYGLLFGLIFTQIINVGTYYFFSLRSSKITLQEIK